MEAAWTEAYARQQLEAWSRSGLTITAFARREHLPVQRLFWWRDRLGFATKKASPASPKTRAGAPTPATRPDAAAKTAFAPAVVKRASRVTIASSAAVVITTRSGRSIEITEVTRVPASWVGAVVRELERTR